MKASILIKLETLVERYEEVQHLLGDPDVLGNQDKFRALSKEYSQLEEVTGCFKSYQQAQEDLEAAEEMAMKTTQKCVKWLKKKSKMRKRTLNV